MRLDTIYFILYWSFIHNFWHRITKSKNCEETNKKNVVPDQEKKQSMELGSKIARMMELSDNNFKITVINILEDLVGTIRQYA